MSRQAIAQHIIKDHWAGPPEKMLKQYSISRWGCITPESYVKRFYTKVKHQPALNTLKSITAYHDYLHDHLSHFTHAHGGIK